MSYRTNLSGRFERINSAYLRDRANDTTDKRHIFYRTILDHDTYEAYLATVGNIKVNAPGFGDSKESITGRTEIFYTRRNKRVVDAPNWDTSIVLRRGRIAGRAGSTDF